MSLIIEDGSIVAGAESFATVAELRQFAANRGKTVPAADGDCEVLLRKACDYLQGQEQRYKGDRITSTQVLAFPRMNMQVNGFYLSSSSIPADVKNAQMQLAIDAQTIELLPSIDVASQATGPTVEKTVGPITQRFAEPAAKHMQSWFAAAEASLAKFCNAGPGQVKLVRG